MDDTIWTLETIVLRLLPLPQTLEETTQHRALPLRKRDLQVQRLNRVRISTKDGIPMMATVLEGLSMSPLRVNDRQAGNSILFLLRYHRRLTDSAFNI